MKVDYQYDQDPRYGWASIDVSEDKNPLIVIHTASGSKGYTVNSDDELVGTCICHAYYSGECGCTNLPKGYWRE
jgi:hypothetical protein